MSARVRHRIATLPVGAASSRPLSWRQHEERGMRTTVIGLYDDFAAASRASAALMKAGFAQAEISIVGHEAVDDGSRFAYAGALAPALSGAREHDFANRLVEALARLGVPPRQAA